MNKVALVPIFAAVLFASACGEDGPTAGASNANVRFVNATTGMTGNGGFTMNGQFATRSVLAVGQVASTCTPVNAGLTAFGFGAANAGGTELSGNALTALNGQTLTSGGKYTVAAAGSETSATLFLLDDSFSGTLASNQAAVRFLNLAPGTDTPANTFGVYLGEVEPNEAPIAINMVAGTPTAFRTVASGLNTFVLLRLPGHTLLPSSAVTLQARSVNTLAIVPDPTSNGFKLIAVPSC